MIPLHIKVSIIKSLHARTDMEDTTIHAVLLDLFHDEHLRVFGCRDILESMETFYERDIDMAFQIVDTGV